MNRFGYIAALVLCLSGPAQALEVGDKAPDFELQSSQAGKFKLSDFAGKKNVLVQFYVLDYTPT